MILGLPAGRLGSLTSRKLPATHSNQRNINHPNQINKTKQKTNKQKIRPEDAGAALVAAGRIAGDAHARRPARSTKRIDRMQSNTRQPRERERETRHRIGRNEPDVSQANTKVHSRKRSIDVRYVRRVAAVAAVRIGRASGTRLVVRAANVGLVSGLGTMMMTTRVGDGKRDDAQNAKRDCGSIVSRTATTRHDATQHHLKARQNLDDELRVDASRLGGAASDADVPRAVGDVRRYPQRVLRRRAHVGVIVHTFCF
jgi:hypothetical protein